MTINGVVTYGLRRVLSQRFAEWGYVTCYVVFFHGLPDHGLCLMPSQFEAAFVSLAHTPEDIAYAAKQVRAVLG